MHPYSTGQWPRRTSGIRGLGRWTRWLRQGLPDQPDGIAIRRLDGRMAERMTDRGDVNACQQVMAGHRVPPIPNSEKGSQLRVPCPCLGEAVPVIGKLLGHSDIETTGHYTHLAHDSIHDAALVDPEKLAAPRLFFHLGRSNPPPIGASRCVRRRNTRSCQPHSCLRIAALFRR